MSGPEDIFLTPGNLRLHVNCWGDPAAAPVMLIHGMWDHSRSWDRIAGVLARNYRVIAPDLRGHGDSAWASPDGYTLGAYVLDLADVMHAMTPEPLALVGHSLGGVLALRLAAAFPERITALAGIECVTLPIQRDEITAPKPYPQRLRGWIEQRQVRYGAPDRTLADVTEACDRLRQNEPELDAATIHHLASHGLRQLQSGRWRWKFDPANRSRPPEDQRGADLREVLAALTCPTLLLYGDAAKRPPPGPDVMRLMPRAHLELIAGGCHSLHHQRRDQFLDLLIPFLKTNHGQPVQYGL